MPYEDGELVRVSDDDYRTYSTAVRCNAVEIVSVPSRPWGFTKGHVRWLVWKLRDLLGDGDRDRPSSEPATGTGMPSSLRPRRYASSTGAGFRRKATILKAPLKAEPSAPTRGKTPTA